MTKTALLLVLVGRIAAADPAPRTLVVHIAPDESPVGAPIALEAMLDAPYAEAVVVRWRPIGDASWRDAAFERSSTGGWYAMLPPASPPGVEYYIRGTDGSGAEVDHFASANAPHRVSVEPSVDDQLEVLDRARSAERTEEIAFDVMEHDFGNRYGHDDSYVRGELVYTHRLLRFLHEVGFGFGSIQGNTPDMDGPSATSVGRGVRYGFGQIRVRFHPSVFFDGRLGLGVSQTGFEQNVRGALTFGKPWRSNVSVGGEYFGDLGGSAFMRLQWDTAPPVLMGASIVRTDLPGSMISPIGLYVAYDVAFKVIDRVTLRGQVSYGGRDGAARFGGGFGTAVAF